MKRHKQTTVDWLSALTIMGRILIFVPVIVGLIGFVFSFFLPNEIAEESVIEGPTTIAVIQNNAGLQILTGGSFLIFLCGLVVLVYVAIKRFRQGLRGEVDIEEDRK